MKRVRLWSALVGMAYTVALSVQSIHAQTEFEVLASATNQEIRTFLGADNAKMVYVNVYGGVKTLHWLDFSEGDGEPVVHRIAAADNPTSPMLSPDGNWVVYSKCVSGSSCGTQSGEHNTPVNIRTSTYICKLDEAATPVELVADSAYEPRFLWEGTPQKTAGQLTVVYATLAQPGSWYGPGQTRLIDVDTTGGTAVPGTPRTLYEHGAYCGGVSVDGKYLCSAGDWAVMVDLESTATEPDTVTHPYAQQQCNPSISPSTDNPGAMLYLDFSGTGTIPAEINDGQGWGQWEIIWMSDDEGNWLQWYKYPEEPEIPYSYLDSTEGHIASSSRGWETFRYASWHHEEWSNHPYFAASAVVVDRAYRLEGWMSWQHTQHQERAYLIDLVSGDYLEVIRRKNLDLNLAVDSAKSNGIYWPNLWVDIPDGFSETPGWSQVSVDKPSIAPHVGGAVRLSLAGNVLNATEPLRSVAVYTLLGSVVKRVDMPRAATEVTLGAVPAGTYFVQATTASGNRATVRWMVR